MSIIRHVLSDADRAVIATTLPMLRAAPALEIHPATRAAFDTMIDGVPHAREVEYERDAVGGIDGWWCRPVSAPVDAAILYFHGGGYVIGSAAAFRPLCGHIAASAGVAVFIAEYSLAPEWPFPAAFNDAWDAYDALSAMGIRVALGGDSAGGGLALALLAELRRQGQRLPRATVAVSPWTDLTMSGASFDERSSADPLLSRKSLKAPADLYLHGGDPFDRRASPLFAELSGLTPVQIHVGESEVLLSDSLQFGEKMSFAGSDVAVHVWEGMLHVFVSSIAELEASKRALTHIGAFLSSALALR